MSPTSSVKGKKRHPRRIFECFVFKCYDFFPSLSLSLSLWSIYLQHHLKPSQFFFLHMYKYYFISFIFAIFKNIQLLNVDMNLSSHQATASFPPFSLSPSLRFQYLISHCFILDLMLRTTLLWRWLDFVLFAYRCRLWKKKKETLGDDDDHNTNTKKKWNILINWNGRRWKRNKRSVCNTLNFNSLSFSLAFFFLEPTEELCDTLSTRQTHSRHN